MTQELWRLDATQTAAAVRAGEVTARQVAESHLSRLAEVNPALNAVVHTFADEALAEAAAADARQRAGEPTGPLHGVPVTIKITADQRGQPTDNGVSLFRHFVAAEDSEVVARLRRAGAVIIGRTNSPAFAMRFMTDNVLHGKTFNPWGRQLACGGSSGGAGAAVASGIGAVAHGSDIGGSIRFPAFCNGVVGLRPTPGRVPTHNPSSALARPLAAQVMAVAGPLARSVRDVRLAFEVMAGPHPSDPLTVDVPLHGAALTGRTRVALLAEPDGAPVHEATQRAVREAGAHLRAAGYDVDELPASAFPPAFADAATLWNRIGMAEIRGLIEPLLAQVGDPGLERSLRYWWDICGPVSAAEVFAAFGERDRRVRLWQAFLENYPVVVVPAFGAPSAEAFCDARDREGMEFLLTHGRFLLGLSTLGFPVLSLPVGTHDGLPQGVQIFSRRFREDLCLAAGDAIEAATGPRPPIDPRA